MARVRWPAVAGVFYPANPTVLARQVDAWLGASPLGVKAGPPVALIVPHAGYTHSGPVAASAYARLRGSRARRVLLLGTCHFLPLRGLAESDVDALGTPLGEVPVDEDLRRRALALPQVARCEEAHTAEHALEVQLPFLQRVLGPFSVLPLLVGSASAGEVAEVLDALWDEDVLPVVSSDLSHYLPYEDARKVDARTAGQVVSMRGALDAHSACGASVISGLMLAAKRRGLRAELLDLRSSRDTMGEDGDVVGYGAFAFYRPARSRAARRTA